MASTSETSFGARLRKFKDAITYVSTWQDFQPPRREETIDQLEILATETERSNKQETAQQKSYSDAVQYRHDLFVKAPGSIIKLLPVIKSAIVAKYGKQSKLLEQVKSIATTMTNAKLIKLPKDPANPDNERTISQSQQSYGSRTQYFKDIITVLEEAGDYVSANAAAGLLALKAKAQEIDSANDGVSTNLQSIITDRRQRTACYANISDRMTRLKAYAINKYGNTSSEYRSLTKLGL